MKDRMQQPWPLWVKATIFNGGRSAKLLTLGLPLALAGVALPAMATRPGGPTRGASATAPPTPRDVELVLDAEKLRLYGLTPDKVGEQLLAIEESGVVPPVLTIRTPQGTSVRLEDLGRMSESTGGKGPQYRIGAVRIRPVGGTTATRPAEFLYDATSVGDEVVNHKTHVDITAEQAQLLFDDAPTRLRSGWEEHLPAGISVVLRANAPAEMDMSRLAPPRDAAPRAEVAHFSKSKLHIQIYRPAGSILWTHYKDQIAYLVVNRDAWVDKLFDLPALEKRFATSYRGLEQGDSRQKVIQTLGEPEKVELTQAEDYSTLIYAQGKVRIALWRGAVNSISVEAPADTRPARE